jgi:dolichyl-phosphate beta-glucosyltransferase
VEERGHPGGAPVELSLVLACYNEEPWLADSVREIVRVLDFSRLSYELVFVDDASRDGTRDVIRGLVAAHPQVPMRTVFHERNSGRGGAVADGMRAATGGIVGFLDVDLEVHPRHIPACCLAIRQGAQVAVGARVFALVLRGLLRQFLSWGYAGLVHVLLPAGGIRDTESGCKFFLREAVLPVLEGVRDRGWFWDTEIMIRCRLAGFAVANVPCIYVRNPVKPSSVSLGRDIVESLWKLFAFRRELRRSGLLRNARARA